MLCDVFDAVMASCAEVKRFPTRVMVRTDGKLILERRDTPENKDYIILETCHFAARYSLRSERPKYQGKPYTLTLPSEIRSRRRYRDWADFCEECKHDPVLNWFKQWSNLSEEFFAFLSRNIGLSFVICVDYIGYEKHLRELYKETFGEDPDRSLLCEPYEGEAGAAAEKEFKDTLYEDSKERIVQQQRERREKSRKEKENR